MYEEVCMRVCVGVSGWMGAYVRACAPVNYYLEYISFQFHTKTEFAARPHHLLSARHVTVTPEASNLQKGSTLYALARARRAGREYCTTDKTWPLFNLIMFPAGPGFPTSTMICIATGFAEMMLIRTLRHDCARGVESLITRSFCFLFTIATAREITTA